jgi:hypothetical protein
MSTSFNFQYDATAGILIAEALREKAEAEIQTAQDNDRMAALQENRGLQPLYELHALQARNRAQILKDAADEIQKTVHEELVRNFDAAFTRMGM